MKKKIELKKVDENNVFVPVRSICKYFSSLKISIVQDSKMS